MTTNQAVHIMQLNAEDIDQVANEEDGIQKITHNKNQAIPVTVVNSKISYKCALCIHKFDSEKKLLCHRIKHNKCFKCQKQFSCQKKLFVHASLDCRTTSELICLFCRKQYENRQTFESHLSEHEGKLVTHNCDVCNVGLLSKEEFRLHNLTQHVVSSPAISENQNLVTQKRKVEQTQNFKEQTFSNETDHIEVTLEPCSQITKKMRASKEIKKFKVSKDGLVLIDDSANPIEGSDNMEGYTRIHDAHVEGAVIGTSSMDSSRLGEVVELRVTGSSGVQGTSQPAISGNDLYFQNIEDGLIEIVNLEEVSNVNIPAEYVVNEDGTIELQIEESFEVNGSPKNIVLEAEDASALANYREVKEDENPFKCGYCSQPYSDSMELFVHMTQEHYDKLDRH